MEKMWTLLKKLGKETQGTETVEWAILAGLVTIVAAGAWVTIGTQVQLQINTLYQAMIT